MTDKNILLDKEHLEQWEAKIEQWEALTEKEKKERIEAHEKGRAKGQQYKQQTDKMAKRVAEYQNSKDFIVYRDIVVVPPIKDSITGKYITKETTIDYTADIEYFKDIRHKLKDIRHKLIEPHGGTLLGFEKSILDDINKGFKIEKNTIKSYMDRIKDPVLYHPDIMEYIAKCYTKDITHKARPKKAKHPHISVMVRYLTYKALKIKPTVKEIKKLISDELKYSYDLVDQYGKAYKEHQTIDNIIKKYKKEHKITQQNIDDWQKDTAIDNIIKKYKNITTGETENQENQARIILDLLNTYTEIIYRHIGLMVDL